MTRRFSPLSIFSVPLAAHSSAWLARFMPTLSLATSLPVRAGDGRWRCFLFRGAGPFSFSGPECCLFKVKHRYRTKSSHHLSLVGMSIRYAAILIILIKFITISDVPLIIGEGLIVFNSPLISHSPCTIFANRQPPISRRRCD